MSSLQPSNGNDKHTPTSGRNLFEERRMTDGKWQGQKLGRTSATWESAIQGNSVKTQSRSQRTIKPLMEMMEEKNVTNDRDSFPCPSEGANF